MKILEQPVCDGKIDLWPRRGRGYAKSQTIKQINEYVKDFYNRLSNDDNTVVINFDGDPYQWASMVILYDQSKDELICVSSPKAKNGDSDWWAYHDVAANVSSIKLSEAENDDNPVLQSAFDVAATRRKKIYED